MAEQISIRVTDQHSLVFEIMCALIAHDTDGKAIGANDKLRRYEVVMKWAANQFCNPKNVPCIIEQHPYVPKGSGKWSKQVHCVRISDLLASAIDEIDNAHDLAYGHKPNTSTLIKQMCLVFVSELAGALHDDLVDTLLDCYKQSRGDNSITEESLKLFEDLDTREDIDLLAMLKEQNPTLFGEFIALMKRGYDERTN